MLRVFRVINESGLKQRCRYRITQRAQGRLCRILDANNLQVDVFRHASDKSVSASERSPSPKDKLERFTRRRCDRSQRPYYKPVFFDKCRARQFEVFLNFQ